jgi:hypothetical protein
MTPSSTTLSDGVQGGIGTYNAALLAAIVVVLVIGAIVWFRRR